MPEPSIYADVKVRTFPSSFKQTGDQAVGWLKSGQRRLDCREGKWRETACTRIRGRDARVIAKAGG